ncbi:GNAT family N-acetyltransferase [Polyangium jinanense]|uniref:GNAT family N-acetyltransferase n=1 Tax=Polyangium jinanense TaxID=2829994 RepID=A0A9X3XCH2_9BACT|nr:GNAT family N-acetyltransferase [Polyangium jinanense]MDC3956839.1 GNAT family N-acetyltransferase [Polyangium jinanense]MDC3957690.1 GNAT family N-acetyltransferase [Polyangium jinanense]MDC3987797.1 GNAT family N-acetyltransferase [Polyangium jinanense]
MSAFFSARPATAADYDTYARLFPELGTDDPTLSREVWGVELMPHTLILEQGSELIGYAYVVVLKETGYVRHVVVAPEARGKGAGRALMRASAERFRAAGCSRWCLNVKVENTVAIALYSSLGMAKMYESTPMRLSWDVLARLPGGEEGITARAIDPREDAALEAAFGLPIGSITVCRARAGWVLLRLVDAAQPEEARVGFACFNPSFPGSFPFRVARPKLVRPLLEAVRPHARPEDAFTQVVVEGDPETKRALIEAGASVRMEIVNMEGPIPERV